MFGSRRFFGKSQKIADFRASDGSSLSCGLLDLCSPSSSSSLTTVLPVTTDPGLGGGLEIDFGAWGLGIAFG